MPGVPETNVSPLWLDLSEFFRFFFFVLLVLSQTKGDKKKKKTPEYSMLVYNVCFTTESV